LWLELASRYNDGTNVAYNPRVSVADSEGNVKDAETSGINSPDDQGPPPEGLDAP